VEVSFGVEALLFDIRPKRCRRDLYDFDEEYRRLVSSLDKPLIVVRGLRRTGKTSLILTVLEETRTPYILVDLREGYRSRREFYKILSRSMSDFLKRISVKRKLLDVLVRGLRILRGVSIAGLNVSLSWGRDRPLLTDIFRELDYFSFKSNLRIVLVFDEIQKLTGVVKEDVVNAIAYAFDYMENLTFILSGSEMGLLYGILRDPKSPLYGRAYIEIETRKLSRNESLDFLVKGFKELNMNMPLSELEEAVNTLDGIIGWLTYYGYSKWTKSRSLEEIRSEAIALARSELLNFIKYRVSRRYPIILRALAQGIKEWSELKRYIERIEKREVSDRVIHDILKQLKKHSIIDDNLEFTDPIIKEAAKTL